MNRIFSFKTIAVIVGTGAALCAVVPAQAGVYGLSGLSVSNLSLVSTGGQVSVNDYTYNLTNTATLNGVSTISTATCNSTGTPCSVGSPSLDASPANAPGGSPTRANNNFGFIGFGGTTSYSNSDSVFNSSAFVQGVPTSSQEIAESLLQSVGSAAASSLAQTNATLSISASTGAGINLSVSFSADPDLEARIANATGSSSLAQADSSFTFTLRNANGQFVTWAPTGTAANDCFTNLAGVFCTETADSQSLNSGVSTGTNNTDVTSSYDTMQRLSAFGLNIIGLGAGTYTLTIASGVSTSVRQVAPLDVPEPETLALMGIALFGLAASSRRRSARLPQR